MRLIIGYDGSNCAEAALDDLQRAGLPASAEVQVVMVTETWMAPLVGGIQVSGVEAVAGNVLVDQQAADRRRQLEKATARLKANFPGWTIESVIESGSPAATILNRAEEFGADLVVVGSHGFTTIERFFIGSVSQRIAAEAHCSVRIARGRLEEVQNLPARLIIGVDGSIDSDMAIFVVGNRIWPEGSEVRLVTSIGPLHPGHHAATIAEEQALIEKMHDHAATSLRRGNPHLRQVDSVISFEDPKHAIVREAETWGADTIFLGSRGLGKLGRFMLGSVSSAIATRAHCSVEIVRRISTANLEEGTDPGGMADES